MFLAAGVSANCLAAVCCQLSSAHFDAQISGAVQVEGPSRISASHFPAAHFPAAHCSKRHCPRAPFCQVAGVLAVKVPWLPRIAALARGCSADDGDKGAALPTTVLEEVCSASSALAGAAVCTSGAFIRRLRSRCWSCKILLSVRSPCQEHPVLSRAYRPCTPCVGNPQPPAWGCPGTGQATLCSASVGCMLLCTHTGMSDDHILAVILRANFLRPPAAVCILAGVAVIGDTLLGAAVAAVEVTGRALCRAPAAGGLAAGALSSRATDAAATDHDSAPNAQAVRELQSSNGRPHALNICSGLGVLAPLFHRQLGIIRASFINSCFSRLALF